ncbi:hypothetical protein BGZ74_011266 [Mortierella antarctica]|nr:hypothetical protein BGZ74_011266 [Mortierella antarctica]
MANNPLILFCVVDGEATSEAFPVSADKIPDTFNGVDAKSLTLCKVSIPTTEDNDETSISVDNVSNNNKLTNPKILFASKN